MKTNRLITLLASGAVWAGLSASAFSDPITIRIVASNGDRNATQTAISKLLTDWTYNGNVSSGASSASSANPASVSVAAGSNFGAWNGTYDGQQVIIKTSYSGALAGIGAVAGDLDARFVTVDGTGTGSVPNPLTSTTFETGKADFGLSTNFQSTSPFNRVFGGVTYSTVTEQIVGISPLGFYASPGFPGSPSSSNPSFVPNITTQLARQLYTQGYLPLAHFTGDWTSVNPGEDPGQGTGDRHKIVYAIGRNTDAGQRFGAYTEIGLGTTTQVRVWFPTITGTSQSGNVIYGGTANEHVLWPVATQPSTIPALAVPLGSGGFNAGQTLAPVLTARLGVNAYKGRFVNDDTPEEDFLNPKATAGYYIGYLTPGDAGSRVVGGVVPSNDRGVSLSFNGVPLTEDNVKNGTYTAWLYNRILLPAGGLPTGVKANFAEALRVQISTVDAVAGGGLKNDDTVFVKRSTDGGDVVSK